MRNKGLGKLLSVVVLSILLSGASFFFLKNASGMNITTKTYIIISKKNAAGLQSLAIRQVIRLSLKKAVLKLIGKKILSNKNNENILNTQLFPFMLRYIYSFKIIDTEEYFNLYYIKMNVYVRKKNLINELKSFGFKIIKPTNKNNIRKASYNIYYVKFIGNFKYANSNKLQELMIKYSRHLKNLYVSSFSDSFVEIKILYYGNMIKFFKRVKYFIKSYLNAKVYSAKNNVIVVDVK